MNDRAVKCILRFCCFYKSLSRIYKKNYYLHACLFFSPETKTLALVIVNARQVFIQQYLKRILCIQLGTLYNRPSCKVKPPVSLEFKSTYFPHNYVILQKGFFLKAFPKIVFCISIKYAYCIRARQKIEHPQKRWLVNLGWVRLVNALYLEKIPGPYAAIYLGRVEIFLCVRERGGGVKNYFDRGGPNRKKQQQRVKDTKLGKSRAGGSS